MLHPGVRLATLLAQQGHIKTSETFQMKSEWLANDFQHGFHGQLPPDDHLPLVIKQHYDELDCGDDSLLLFQLLDASTVVIMVEQPDPAHPTRHLVRMETVVWAATERADSLHEATKLHLQCGGDAILYAVFDSAFECTTAADQPWEYLCLAMPRSTGLTLLQQSKRLDEQLDFAMCLGLRVEFGRTEKQVEDNARNIDKAHLRAVVVFDKMAGLDAVVSPVTGLEQLEPFMKPGSCFCSPQPWDWTIDIDDYMGLRHYLKKP